MREILPEPSAIKVVQHPDRPKKSDFDRLDHLIAVIPARPGTRIWQTLPDGQRLKALARRLGADADLHGRLANAPATGVTVARLSAGDREAGEFGLLQLARRLASQATGEKSKRCGILILGLDDAQTDALAHALVLALGAHHFRLPQFKQKKTAEPTALTITLIGLGRRIDVTRTLIEIEAANLARWLTRLPPNKLDAGAYRRCVGELARRHGWTMKFLDEAALKKKGAGAFLAVSQGNANRDAGIIHLQYRPTKKRRPILSLVGKGIVFDTGGTNLKPFKAMLDMHEDMAGSAVALATLLALTRLEFAYPVDCWLAITENRISAEAYKSRDIVTASNGVTIEIIHTDAEGRMALADTLALAGAENPGLIIDYATLTGTCISALTERYSGVFTNRAALNAVLVDAGSASGERVWPFPMDADFESDLKSKAADILQCATGGGGDHIHAARFLQRFVPQDSAWVHVDLSAATSRSGLGQVPAGPTGFGVRWTLNLLLDQGPRLEALIGHGDRSNA